MFLSTKQVAGDERVLHGGKKIVREQLLLLGAGGLGAAGKNKQQDNVARLSKVNSTDKDQVNGSKNGSQIEQKLKISEKEKQNARGNKKSAKYVANSERKEEEIHESIWNGNIDDKKYAREAFAMPLSDEETTNDAGTDAREALADVLKDSKVIGEAVTVEMVEYVVKISHNEAIHSRCPFCWCCAK